MNLFLYPLFFISIVVMGVADIKNIIDIDLEDYRWKNRLVLIFAPSSDCENYLQQIENLTLSPDGLIERDVLIFSLFQLEKSYVNDETISQESIKQITETYNPGGKEFRFILIGKDGGVKLDKDTIVQAEDLFGRIDSMPMRRLEMRRAPQGSEKDSRSSDK